MPNKIHQNAKPKLTHSSNNNFQVKIQGVKKAIDCWNTGQKKLPPLTLMEIKKKQKLKALEKLKPFGLK